MLWKKTAAYALLAIYEIATQQKNQEARGGVRAQYIAHKYRLPKAYASKILSQLAGAGILHSDRGPRGGFRLNRASDKISLYDVFRGAGAMAPERGRGSSVKGMPSAVQNTLDRANQETQKMLKDLLAKTTLSDLIRRNGG